ncbi:jerky protein homolog isoform X2 [Thrips palmi]|uniref:Jerky protein homolog isoform X2 n=1 Tax=Thrips palmi TaxID=161013 RepID=A0A6P8ZQW6_THRPL|nr:jerky protein homolog isoform X2 [Thrips palmi]
MPATTAPRPCRQSASGSTSARRTCGPTVPRRRSSSNTDVVVKLSVVRRAASGEDKEALAREVGVSLKTLKRWCKASESLAQFEVTASHNRARNRRFPVLPDLDKAMLEWVVQQRVRDSRLHGGHITEKARQVNAALGGPASFKASNGWLRCFLRRHGLHRRVSAAEPAAGEHDDNQDDVAGEQVSAAEVHMDDAEDASGGEVWQPIQL